MSLGNVSALPFTYVAHILGILSVVMVFIWTIHFRGGINYNSSDTNLIFNVRPCNWIIHSFIHPSIHPYRNLSVNWFICSLNVFVVFVCYDVGSILLSIKFRYDGKETIKFYFIFAPTFHIIILHSISLLIAYVKLVLLQIIYKTRTCSIGLLLL